MDFTNFVEALRKYDRETFAAGLEMIESPREFSSTNQTPYANWFSGVGATLLQLTAFLRPEFAPAVLEKGATMDLHSACALGDVDSIARLLAEDPASLEFQIDTYYPIQFALRHPSALRFLLKHGDQPNRPIRKLAWFDWEDQAAERGLADWRLIHMLALGRGDESHIESAETLKEFGAVLNATASPFGETPLHLAAIYNRTHLIRWFVEHGCDVDTGTADSGRAEAAVDLFDQAPFAPFASHGQTPLMLALGEGQSEAVGLLLELGANVNAMDFAGFTPLHYASGAFWRENPAHVQTLIERGARWDATDTHGHRPFDLAKRKGYDATLAVLDVIQNDKD